MPDYGGRVLRYSAVVTFAICMVCAQGDEAQARTAAATEKLPQTTPDGITLIDIGAPVGARAFPQYLFTRLGTAEGEPLYTYDADKEGAPSSCVGECETRFPPYLAQKDARPSGAWSLLKRADGRAQWAYRGKPLYQTTVAFEKKKLKSGGQGRAAVAPEDLDPASKVYSPEKGWRVVVFRPADGIEAPPGIDVTEIPGADGYGFVNQSGMTIYAMEGTHGLPSKCLMHDLSCLEGWKPVRAPSIAGAVGDFTVVERADQTKQWAYRGKPLFTFSGDHATGDAFGSAAAQAKVLLVSANFRPAQVMIKDVDGKGLVFADKRGQTIYERHIYSYSFGGRSVRGNYSEQYETGKLLGSRACDATCEKENPPLLAAPDAKSSGRWEVISRADGARQWSFKGYAAYTYAGDKVPGDVNGSNRYEVLLAASSRYPIALGVSDDGGGHDGASLYWHVSQPPMIPVSTNPTDDGQP